MNPVRPVVLPGYNIPPMPNLGTTPTKYPPFPDKPPHRQIVDVHYTQSNDITTRTLYYDDGTTSSESSSFLPFPTPEEVKEERKALREPLNHCKWRPFWLAGCTCSYCKNMSRRGDRKLLNLPYLSIEGYREGYLITPRLLDITQLPDSIREYLSR